MAKKLNSILGVDIGSQTIKVAEVRLQGGDAVVTAIGLAPTPEGAVDHIGLHDYDAVGGVLKQLCASIGVTSPDAIVSVAGQGSVLVRTLEVPNMTDGELKQHMEWEITRNIPFAESTIVSDYKSFPPDVAGSANMDVVMAIATQSSVDGIVGMLKKAGKKPAAIDVEPLGIARSLATSYRNDLVNKHVCVVDIGYKTTSINIYRNGKLLMPRQVPVGGEMFTRALADNLGMTFGDAEQAKLTQAEIPLNAGGGVAANPFEPEPTQAFTPYNPFADPQDAPIAPVISEPVVAVPVPSFVPDDSARMYQAMANVLDEFVAEIRRSIEYFRSKGGDVDHVLLAGGGAKLKGLQPFLQSALGLPVDLFDPLRNVSLNAKKSDEAFAHHNAQDFAVAVGNGLHIIF